MKNPVFLMGDLTVIQQIFKRLSISVISLIPSLALDPFGNEFTRSKIQW